LRRGMASVPFRPMHRLTGGRRFLADVRQQATLGRQGVLVRTISRVSGGHGTRCNAFGCCACFGMQGVCGGVSGRQDVAWRMSFCLGIGARRSRHHAPADVLSRSQGMQMAKTELSAAMANPNPMNCKIPSTSPLQQLALALPAPCPVFPNIETFMPTSAKAKMQLAVQAAAPVMSMPRCTRCTVVHFGQAVTKSRKYSSTASS